MKLNPTIRLVAKFDVLRISADKSFDSIHYVVEKLVYFGNQRDILFDSCAGGFSYGLNGDAFLYWVEWKRLFRLT